MKGKPVVLLIPAAVLLYLLWAALHDISQANASDYTFEYVVLGLCVPALGAVFSLAYRALGTRGRFRLLAAAAGILLLLDLAALSATFNPKYGNDVVVGTVFLLASLPVLGCIGYGVMKGVRSFSTARRGT